MPGPTPSILVLSLSLVCLFTGNSCQAANYHQRSASPYPYKHKKQSALKRGSFLSQRQLNGETILAALKASHFKAIDSGAAVTIAGDVLHLAIWTSPRAADSDLKSDTILLAQAIDQHFPGVFEEFDCSFFLPQVPGRCQRAAIRLSALRDFAGEKLTGQQLLAQVDLSVERDLSLAERYQGLTYQQILEQGTVSQGAYEAERKELSDELTTLKANGYDVNQATRQFLALEDLVRTKQYGQLTPAFNRTKKSISEAVANAQGINVASSRTKDWQR